MLETGFAQMRFAASILFGTRFSLRSLDHLIASLLSTQREFGFLRSEGRDLLVSPQLDEETRQAMQLRRFRSQAARAVRETVYYQRLFERLLWTDHLHCAPNFAHSLPVTLAQESGAGERGVSCLLAVL